MVNSGPDEKMGALLSKALIDDGFRKRLLAEPEETLRAEGISLPPEVKVKVVENTADLIHIVLPGKQEALADEALDKVTAGLLIKQEFDRNPPEPKPQPHKKCGNYTCSIPYNSPDCWLRWFSLLGFCKDINFDR